MEHEWSVGDICLIDAYARRDIKVQIKAIIWQKGVGKTTTVSRILRGRSDISQDYHPLL